MSELTSCSTVSNIMILGTLNLKNISFVSAVAQFSAVAFTSGINSTHRVWFCSSIKIIQTIEIIELPFNFIFHAYIKKAVKYRAVARKRLH